jgi:hypothetical protein
MEAPHLVDNTIPLGQSGVVPYIAFGDESLYGDVLAYAYVIAPREAIKQLEQGVLSLKSKYRIPEEKELHCRFLCSPTGRQKGGFSFLTRETVESLLIDAFDLMQKNKAVIRAAFTNFNHHKGRFGRTLKMNDINGGKASTLNVHTLRSGEIDPKVILGTLSNFIWAQSLNGAEPSATECEIFVSAEPSAVKFLGSKARQAQDHYGGFLDINSPPGHVYRIMPKSLTYADSFMVQLSDIAAFTTSHAYSDNPDVALYRNLLRYCADARCSPFNMEYDPTLADDV